MMSMNTVLESIKGKIERCEPLRMEAFIQLEASATNTNNNPLINLVRDMVSNLKKSAANLIQGVNTDKIDPSLVVCKCKYWYITRLDFHPPSPSPRVCAVSLK